MQDHEKTQDQLIDELNEMRRKVAELEAAQKSLTENESRYRQIVDKTSEAIFVIQDGTIKFANEKTSEIVEYSPEEGSTSDAITTFVHPDDREMVAQYYANRLQGDETHHRYAFRIVRRDGNVQWVEMNSSLIMWTGRPASLCLMADITERKRLEEEKETAIVKLQQALSEVKKLSGFLPICASCKKIRDDRGYWNDVERYIGEHSEAEFSHGICPDCMIKLYPEFTDEILSRREKDEEK